MAQFSRQLLYKLVLLVAQTFNELQCERRAFQACPIWNCSAFWSGSLLSAYKYSMTCPVTRIQPHLFQILLVYIANGMVKHEFQGFIVEASTVKPDQTVLKDQSDLGPWATKVHQHMSEQRTILMNG